MSRDEGEDFVCIVWRQRERREGRGTERKGGERVMRGKEEEGRGGWGERRGEVV